MTNRNFFKEWWEYNLQAENLFLRFYKDVKHLNYYFYYFLCVEIFYYFYVITYNLYCLMYDFMIMFYIYQ